jgi:hypothetical protein
VVSGGVRRFRHLASPAAHDRIITKFPSLLLQCMQCRTQVPINNIIPSWMGLGTRGAVGVWFWWMNIKLKFREMASKGPIDVLLEKIHMIKDCARCPYDCTL